MAIVYLLVLIGLALMGAGGWSMVMGFDAVLVERSWAEMVGGAIMTSAGAVIFALALALVEVVRVRRLVATIVDGDLMARPAPEPVVATAPAFAPRPPAPQAEPPPAAPAVEAPAAKPSRARAVDQALGVQTPGVPATQFRTLDEATEEVERALSDIIAANAQKAALPVGATAPAPTPAAETPAPPKAAASVEASPKAPPPGAPRSAEYKPRAGVAADLSPIHDDLARLLGAEPPARPEPPVAAAIADEPPLAPLAPDKPEAPPVKRADIVRSFVIGANTYTIYADGSIGAVTPNGPRSFASFEEMRGFIEQQSAQGRIPGLAAE